jgi:hypothetical protein
MGFAALLFLVLAAAPAAAQDPLAGMVEEVRAGLEARKDAFLADSLPAPELRSAVDWLERQYALAGLPVRIEGKAEFDAYYMSMMFATAPDSQFVRMSDDGVNEKGRTAFLAAWLDEMYALSPVPFSREAWRAAGSGPKRERYRMFKDLRERVDFEGMLTAELEALLGAPDRTGEGHVVYRLGTGLGIMDENELRFEVADGRITRYRIVGRRI